MDGVCDLCTKVAPLLAVQLVPIKRLKDKRQSETGSILICGDCKGRLPIDFDALSETIDSAVSDVVGDRDMFAFFITEWILKVWHSGGPPSYQDICNALNKVRIYNSQGTKWSYHNLMARMKSLGIDKDEIAATRAHADYRGKIDDVIDVMRQEALATLATAELSQPPRPTLNTWDQAAVSDVGEPEDWADGAIAPADMPGATL